MPMVLMWGVFIVAGLAPLIPPEGGMILGFGFKVLSSRFKVLGFTPPLAPLKGGVYFKVVHCNFCFYWCGGCPNFGMAVFLFVCPSTPLGMT